MSPRALFGLGLVGFLIAVPLLSAGCWAMPLRDEIDVYPGWYHYLRITSGGVANGSDIDITWQSTLPIDVWLMDRSNFEKYESMSAFNFEMAQNGSSGSVRFNISAEQKAAEPFYLVFDNSALGPSAPPANGPTTGTVLVFSGATRMETYQAGTTRFDPGAKVFGAVLMVAVAIALFSIVAALLTIRRRKKRRLAAIREQLWGAPDLERAKTPATGTPTIARASAPSADSPPPVAPLHKVCRSCASALAPGNVFCTECGAPL